MTRIVEEAKRRARLLKAETYALYLAYRDPRVPWYARVFAACVVAYAFSPIDLIPDPIPVLGYLDDLVLIPLGVALALKMIPPQVMAENRAKAHELMSEGKPVSRVAGVVIVAVWLLLAALAVIVMIRLGRTVFTDFRCVDAHAHELSWPIMESNCGCAFFCARSLAREDLR